MHIRNRNDLIGWLESHAPRLGIARAMQEGQVENLGAFRCILSKRDSGWIIKVTSRFNRVWYVAIQLNYSSHEKMTARVINCVPWEYWIGQDVENKLYRGDKPVEYKLLRDKELQYDTRETEE